MRCLVMGSAKHEGVNEAAFALACRQIGKELAERGHTLIINATEPWTADLQALEGANTASNGPPTVILLQPSNRTDRHENALYQAAGYVPDGHDPQDMSRFKNVKLQTQAIGGLWPGNRIQAISRADVVILIGGRFGVAAVGASAPLLKTPVVAISTFGGAASDVWEEANYFYGQAGISQDDASALRSDWNSRSASAVIRVAEALVKKNPFKRDQVSHILVASSIVVLLVSWVAAYLLGGRSPSDVSLFGMLGLSALLGTGLRTELRLLADDSSLLSGRRIGVEAATGLLLAFIFCLLYLAGNFVLTGTFVTLNGKQPNDFSRVAITLSLLGISTAFLLEPAAENVRMRLEKLLKRET